MRQFRLLALVILAGCTAASRTRVETAPGIAGIQSLVADRLFFGLGIPGGGTVPDTAWTTFMRDVVTKHFPEGLTVYRGEGQWTGPDGILVHETAMVVEVFHPRGVPSDSTFASIANEYVRRFHQDAVLRTTYAVGTQLYTGPHK